MAQSISIKIADRPYSLKVTSPEQEELIRRLEKEMREAARILDFERAAELRDMILEMKAEE